MPKVCRVLKGLESVSTIEIVLLPELDVRIAPVCGFSPSEVGFIPTLAELPPPVSGLKAVITFEPLELAKNSPLFGVRVTTAGSNTMPVGVAVTEPGGMVVLRAGVWRPISPTASAPNGDEPRTKWTQVNTAPRRWLRP